MLEQVFSWDVLLCVTRTLAVCVITPFPPLSRIPVTKNSFRVYRVLGKGGFGLVSCL